MGKKYLLDSNTIIDYIAGLFPENIKPMIDQIIDEEINVSIINKIEVLSFAPEKEDNYSILIDFFETSNIFGLTDEIVRKTIEIRQRQKIKLPDAIIASTAIVNGLTLISHNIKDFKNIIELKLINPYQI